MNIVKPCARMLPPPGYEGPFTFMNGIELLRRVEWCARISHRSEEAVTKDSYDRLLRAVVLQHGDWSVTEHASVSVDFYVDRGITHEIVRHRLFAFTQESTRFVNYEKKMPPSFVCPFNGDGASQWAKVIEACEDGYRELLAMGHAPQLGRSVFPNALASRIIVTGNLRNWRHFLLMRTTKEAHPQMREVTIPLLEELGRRSRSSTRISSRSPSRPTISREDDDDMSHGSQGRRDTVDHPAHYNRHPSGVECIDIVEHMTFNLGNAVKYIWRADHKDNAIEDLRKAAWYLEREIDRLQK